MINVIDAALFQQMVIHAAAAIHQQEQSINDLNVFPVPDGDTGTNMCLTIAAASAEMKSCNYASVGQAVSATASALLRGARGNSGVILSLLFRGFAKTVKEQQTIDGQMFAAALDNGVAAAYKAVMKPAEGTILTVSRLSAAAAIAATQEDNSVEVALTAALKAGHEALANTINQNPVLKKAGVVDAGGKGLLVILQGMLDEIHREPIPEVNDSVDSGAAQFSELTDEEITFAFDTVYIVRKHTAEVNLSPLRTYLNSIGDSLVIGEDDDVFKVHVHTNTPGDALTESQKYGTLELAKIENMRTQRDDLAAGRSTQTTDDLDAVERELEHMDHRSESAHAAPEKTFGYVVVCAGAGLESVFRDLGADALVGGGQTMNPSTQDILKAIDATPAEIVYVLPNNKNIIMAAEQCIPLCKDKKVVVLPTKTVPQGISAMLGADPDASEQENTAAMIEAFSHVRTSEITYAARDSDFGGFAIKQGDYLALSEHQLFGTDQDILSLLERLAQAEGEKGAEFVSIFYGKDVTDEDAQKAQAIFAAACPDAEINLLPGGQPVYYYVISVE